MLTLKVKEQFWKLPEGRLAPGFTPFSTRKFSCCRLRYLCCIVTEGQTGATAFCKPLGGRGGGQIAGTSV